MANLKDSITEEDGILTIERNSENKKYVSVKLTEYNSPLTFRDRRTIVQLFSISERNVLKHLAKGHSNRQIAEIMCLSIRTIETHRKNMIKKIEAKNTANLIYLAMSRGFLS